MVLGVPCAGYALYCGKGLLTGAKTLANYKSSFATMQFLQHPMALLYMMLAMVSGISFYNRMRHA